MMNVKHIRDHFVQALSDQQFTIDRTGSKTIELLGASFIADEPAIFGTPNYDYIQRELRWYASQSTNVNDIEGDVPQAWKMTANKYGEINSNYGHLIYSKKYFEQFDHVIKELSNNHDSRRASMIYTRPSIWHEYHENGKNDFICTNSVTYYIRNKKVHCVVQMRSNDVVFGYKNDYAWQQHVLNMIANRLYKDPGTITWQVQNLHVYERHFHLVEEQGGEQQDLFKDEIALTITPTSIDYATPQQWNTAHLHHLQHSITQNVEQHSEYYYDTERNKPADGFNGTTSDDFKSNLGL